MILLSFVLGLSTRKVSLTLLPVLGEPVSPQTVSRVASQLDEAVATYHKRSLSDKYQVLLFDGVVIKRKSGVGAQKRTILVAFGIRKDGKKEIIDFKQVQGESQSAWEGFLSDLYKRGLTGESLKKADRETVKKTLHKITHAKNLKEAKQAAQRFVKKWEGQYPKAAKCLSKDLIDLLTFFTIKVNLEPTELRTTNAIERRFKEVRRRTRPMGTFSDCTSVERILFAVFIHENNKEGVATHSF